VGPVGAVVFGILFGAAVGFLAYFGGLYGRWEREPVADSILGAVFAVIGFLRAYFKGIPLPRRWY
jgi:hypothetical protein